MKKTLQILLLVLTLFIITSCKKGDSNELTVFLYEENVVYNKNMPVFKKINEELGIDLKGFLQNYDSDYRNRFTTRGYQSDLVIYDQDTIESYGLNGTYVDLKPLIDAHAPNIKTFFEENPEKEAWATASNGKIYGIPFYTDGKTAKGYFIRNDWVQILRESNKINDIPEDLNTLTVSHYEKLLIAFKENSRLLTGTNTEIYPYFDRDKKFWVSELSSLWGATGEFYLTKEDTVIFGPQKESFKTAIENIARWMDLGLIDPTILGTQTTDARETFFARNTGGSTRDWIGSTYSFNDDIYSDVLPENFEIIAIAPPTNTLGVKTEPTIRKEIGTVGAINSKTSEENQIKLIKWMDYFFTRDGHDALNYGIKDETYEIVNNKYVFTDKILNDRKTALANLHSYGAQLQSPGHQTFDYELAWLSNNAKEAMTLYENSGFLDTNYTKLIFPNIKLTREDYNTVNSSRTAIEKLIETQVYSWVINKTASRGISENDWNKFQSDLVQAGVNNLIEIYQRYVDQK